MRILTFVFLTIFQWAKQVCLLPQVVTAALRQRRRQILRNQGEAERLDRIRNPSKYLGK